MLRVVESRGRYSGRKVLFVRVFDPARAAERAVVVQRFRDLDAHPESRPVVRTCRARRDRRHHAAAPRPSIPERRPESHADRTAHADDERFVFQRARCRSARSDVMTITDVAWSRDLRGRSGPRAQTGRPSGLYPQQPADRIDATRPARRHGVPEVGAVVPGAQRLHHGQLRAGLSRDSTWWAAPTTRGCSPCIRRCARPSPRTPGTQARARRPPDRAGDDADGRSRRRRLRDPT